MTLSPKPQLAFLEINRRTGSHSFSNRQTSLYRKRLYKYTGEDMSVDIYFFFRQSRMYKIFLLLPILFCHSVYAANFFFIGRTTASSRGRRFVFSADPRRSFSRRADVIVRKKKRNFFDYYRDRPETRCSRFQCRRTGSSNRRM